MRRTGRPKHQASPTSSTAGSAPIWNIHEEAVVKLSERETAESSKHPFGIPDEQVARPLFRTGPIQDGGRSPLNHSKFGQRSVDGADHVNSPHMRLFDQCPYRRRTSIRPFPLRFTTKTRRPAIPNNTLSCRITDSQAIGLLTATSTAERLRGKGRPS